MSRGGRKRRRKVERAVREHERVFGPLRSHMEEMQAKVLAASKWKNTGDIEKLKKAMESGEMKLSPGSIDTEQMQKAIDALPSAGGSVPGTHTYTTPSPELQHSPEMSILTKFGPMKLKHTLDFLQGDHGYLLGGPAPGQLAMIFGVEITDVELVLLKAWAAEEPPYGMNQFLAYGKPGVGKTFGPAPGKLFPPKPGPNPFGTDLDQT